MSRASLKSVSRLIDIANDEKPVNEQFLTDVCRSIELESEKHWGIPSKTFKPSGMRCPRDNYYTLMGVEPDKGSTSHNMIGIVNSGSDIHERMQSAISKMKDNGIDCEYVSVPDFIESRGLTDLVIREQYGYETKLYNTKYNISFMLDGIIKYRGKYYILEIKTETSNKWYSRDGVDKKHHNQGIAYSLNMGLSDVMFLYIDRDMILVNVHACLRGALKGNAGPGQLRQAIDIIRLDAQRVLDVTPHLLRPCLRAEDTGLQRDLVRRQAHLLH